VIARARERVIEEQTDRSRCVCVCVCVCVCGVCVCVRVCVWTPAVTLCNPSFTSQNVHFRLYLFIKNPFRWQSITWSHVSLLEVHVTHHVTHSLTHALSHYAVTFIIFPIHKSEESGWVAFSTRSPASHSGKRAIMYRDYGGDQCLLGDSITEVK